MSKMRTCWDSDEERLVTVLVAEWPRGFRTTREGRIIYGTMDTVDDFTKERLGIHPSLHIRFTPDREEGVS